MKNVLTTGTAVKLENGSFGLITEVANKLTMIKQAGASVNIEGAYNEDLTSNKSKSFNINEAFQVIDNEKESMGRLFEESNLKTIWKRKEKLKLIETSEALRFNGPETLQLLRSYGGFEPVDAFKAERNFFEIEFCNCLEISETSKARLIGNLASTISNIVNGAERTPHMVDFTVTKIAEEKVYNHAVEIVIRTNDGEIHALFRTNMDEEDLEKISEDFAEFNKNKKEGEEKDSNKEKLSELLTVLSVIPTLMANRPPSGLLGLN